MPDRIYYEIRIPTCPGDEKGVPLCEADSPQIASAVIMAVMSSERRKPDWVMVVPRLEIKE